MIAHLFPHLRRPETAPPAVAPMPVSLPPIAAPERIEQLVMRRPVAREIEPCEVRFFRCGPNIVARFFDARGRSTGQGDHPGCWSVSDFVDFYWPRGWEVTTPIESPDVPAHSEACTCAVENVLELPCGNCVRDGFADATTQWPREANR